MNLYKHAPHVSFVLSIFLLGMLVASHRTLRAQDLIHDIWTYTPGEWRNFEPGVNWTDQWKPMTKVYNLILVKGDLPKLGYPMRPAIFVGLNDTLQLQISLRNPTASNYSLVGKSVEKWFAPRVFDIRDDPVTAPAWRDSSVLKYRARYWWDENISRRVSAPSTVNGNDTFSPTLIMDAWNLPPGIFYIAGTKTASVPGDINAYVDGDFYEYFYAQSGQDSINAYEALFWRAMQDSNYSAATSWLGKMYAVNSKSVPGWWLKAEYYRIRGDSTNALAACDSAIKFISTGTDSLMPNRPNRAMFPAEQHYLEFCNQGLRLLRERLTP